MPKMTEREYKACYDLSRRVQKKELARKDAIKELASKWGMNEISAIISVDFFQRIMEGENPKRTISEAHMRYYLQRITKDYGRADLEKVLSAISDHIDYYENMLIPNMRFGIRRLHNEFSQLVGFSPIFEAKPQDSVPKGETINFLIENAFDFLEIAIEQLEKDDSKYSVISFCTAVELFFKARLMDEHWSLIVDVSGGSNRHPNLNSFNDGRFKSINFNDLLPRIKDVLNENFPSEFENCFKILSEHRNRVIHFFYELNSDDEKREIALEQFNGWDFLRRRLLGKWEKIFGDYSDKIEYIDDKMQKYQAYWDAGYDRIKSDIRNKGKEGMIFIGCSHCRTKANQETIITNFIRKYECLVCKKHDHCIIIKCSECKESIKIFHEYGQAEIVQCQNCLNEVKREKISDILDSDELISVEECGNLNSLCGECSVQKSVTRHRNYYICVNCFYLTKNAMECGCCGALLIGDDISHNTDWSGCIFCSGYNE